jgi:Flp pilus assembly protein TadG
VIIPETLPMTILQNSRLGRGAARVYRLARAEDGVAAVEFAFILPIMLLLFMGAVELSQAVTVDRRVSQVASTTSDLVARKESNISQGTDINDILKVGSYLLAPFKVDTNNRLEITLRNITSSSTSATDLRQKWYCKYDSALPPPPDSPPGTPATESFTCTCPSSSDSDYTYSATSMTGLIGVNDSIVIGEVTYAYRPWPFNRFFQNTWTASSPGVYAIKDTVYQKPRGQAATLNKIDGTQC